MRKLFAITSALVAIAMLAAACTQAGPAATVEVTREVTREVPGESVVATVIVEVTPIGVPVAPGGNRLQTVLDRGKLVCGVNPNLPGFGAPEGDGYAGFDADFCKALAAALFDDPTAVEWRPLSAQDRFTALQAGEVDVLFRNTTWTISRDTSVGMDFGPTTFYDGQGFMVPAALGATSIEDLAGGTICVQSGTTTELNLNDAFAVRGLEFTPVVFDEIDPTYAAYAAEQCDAVTSDISQLVGRRSALPDPEAHIILDAVISKEPLGPVIAQGDSQWRDVVAWVVYATITAEELTIDSTNVDTFLTSTDPNVVRLLGLDPEAKLGEGLGLTDDFAVRVIRHVGNYGEIYNRNLGPDTPLNIPRVLNALWTDGGLIYAPPIR
jgi:general L-amino acid transport system substrate-binding protein